MATKIEDTAPPTLAEANLEPRGSVHPSPVDWRDQVFYQLLPDRFSDGREDERDLFDPAAPSEFKVMDKAAWMAAGTRFTGGTLKGIESKLGYLQNLGVTTLWINPPWKQRAELETYHGYGIQNFLDVDPRFGTRQDLRDLVDAAHERGMYVILDVIYNHSGNNWFYSDEKDGSPKDTMPYRFAPPYPLRGWRSSTGESIPVPLSSDDGVWPAEFQNPDFYTRAGSIGQWAVAYWEDPQSPDVEFRRGDFYDLKDMNLASDEVVQSLARVYMYWIALSDCDGFRVDAVKHVSVEQSRAFCTLMHEYAQFIGKDNFFLTGEITQGDIAPDYVDVFGRNLDAILGIIAYPNRLAGMVKGLAHPNEFFVLYNDNVPGGFYRQLGRYIVHVLDDHDMSSRATKARFASGSDVPNLHQQVAHVVGVQLTTPGIPAIYYGTEQAFDGAENYHDYNVESTRFAEDRYVRESMHGASFGAFCTQGCHFFNSNHPTYLRISAIAHLRNRKDRIGKALRRGHLFPRETSFTGRPFAIPEQGQLVAWSQILFDTEVLMALNPHAFEHRGAEVTVDALLHANGSKMKVLYNSGWSDAELREPPQDQVAEIRHLEDGRAVAWIDLPPSGMMILA